MAWTVHHGDNMAILASLPDASVAAIVTDPPYGLGEPPDAKAMLRAWLDDGHLDVQGRGFMGRSWDAFVPQPAFWRECCRVLKPGGHVVAFASSRTCDLMALGIRLAGFEIRDSLQWLYGTGFPKSERDITAAIDRNRGDDPRPVCRWLRAAVDGAGLVPRQLDELFGTVGMGGHWCAMDSNTQPTIPTNDQWDIIVRTLGVDDSDIVDLVRHLNARKGTPGEAWQARAVVGEHARPAAVASWRTAYADGEAVARMERDGRPVSPEAEPWIGWATALAPGHEPIVLARKPLQGPVYRNALAHGTGALNIGACRLPMDVADADAIAGMGGFGRAGYDRKPGTSLNLSVDPMPSQDAAPHPGGRWPKNVLLDAAAAAQLDGQHGAPVSRFFYCDKASTAEREAGLEAFGQGARWTDGRADTAKDYPSLRGATDRRNVHPTVKPIGVMRWLVRLVTPPGGLVLDPFCGSGSTGIAAVMEGFDFVGIELDPDGAGHVEIARARIQAAEDGAFRATADGKIAVRSPTARKQGRLEF